MFSKIVSFCKRKGFVYPSSEIYGGFSATYDYGPLGALLIRNIQDQWLKHFIYSQEDMHLLDGAIISHPKIWEASGHLSSFNDPLVEDKVTHVRYRADKLLEEKLGIETASLSTKEVNKLLKQHKIKSPEGNPLTEVKEFNLLMEVKIGSVEGRKERAYLRGETCQNIFVDYLNLLKTLGLKIPFGVGQIGKAFRNEITTKRFILRTREFYQMETEYFISPEDGDKHLLRFKKLLQDFFSDILGLPKERFRFREIKGKEMSHYAKKQYDVEFKLNDGTWLELTPLNHRGDWDLSRHQRFSGADMVYKKNNQYFIPNVIETSIGLDRLFYVLLEYFYNEEKERVVLRLPPSLAPYKIAVFPLLRNKTKLVSKARDVFNFFKKNVEKPIVFDDNGNIGKRYRRQDEIGTPFCVTIDYQTLEDGTVTVRERDNMKQRRVKIEELITSFSF